jgi:hypothetical protein
MYLSSYNDRRLQGRRTQICSPAFLLFVAASGALSGGTFAVLEAVIWYQAASFYSFNTE